MAVPSYLIENMDKQYKNLLSKDENGKYFSIPFLTDIHNDETTTTNGLSSTKVIEEINRRRNRSWIIAGGDYINNNPNKKVVMDKIKNFRDRFSNKSNLFSVLGNHDDNSRYRDFNNFISHSEMKSLMFSSIDANFGSDFYYYKDFSQYKVRMIVLNSQDLTSYTNPMTDVAQWTYVYSDAQLKWVANVALNVASDWKVFFVTHIPMIQEKVEGFDYGINNADVMLGIMKAFKDGTSYSVNRQGKYPCNINVSYAKKGTIACVLFGHVHCDNLLYKDGIAHISTSCDANQRWGSAPSYVAGTKNEYAFDVITIKNGAGLITRFGAGNDREFTFVDNTISTPAPTPPIEAPDTEIPTVPDDGKFAEEEIGLLEIYGFDQNGGKLFKAEVSDVNKYYEYVEPKFYIGNSLVLDDGKNCPSPRKVVSGEDKQEKEVESGVFGDWNDCNGKFVIRREKNSAGQYIWSVSIYSHKDGKIIRTMSTPNGLSNSAYPKGALNYLGFYIGKLGNNRPVDIMGISDVRVRKLNMRTDSIIDSNESLFNKGDHLQINFESGLVTLNDIEILTNVDIGSEFFKIPSGRSQIVVRTDDDSACIVAGIQEKFL